MKVKSDYILELESKIKKGDNGALDKFWDTIKEIGTPLIEELDQETDLVTFIYKSEDKIDNILLISPIGWLNLEDCKMERLLDTNLWHITYKLRNDLRLFYYFSLNDNLDKDWAKRFANSKHDIFNKNYTKLKHEGKDKIRSFAMLSKTKEHKWVNERSNINKGELHEQIFVSEILKDERRVRVYTPYGYNKDKTYGYLVLTDGEDYIETLNAKNILDNLIHENEIPPIIAVFIDSTKRRSEELKCSDDFAETIVNEILPWVSNTYNITTNPDESIIGGLSLGGLFASYMGLKYSNIFGNVLSQSGSYWYKPEGYNGDCWMGDEYISTEKLPLKFYLNVGVLEHKEQMIDTNKKLREMLVNKGYNVIFEEFESGHDHLCWDETLANGLMSLLGLNK